MRIPDRVCLLKIVLAPAQSPHAELQSAMAALNVNVTVAQAEEMVQELDVNARGAIQLPQFYILMERYTQVGLCSF